jgi:hypothetical protein
LVAPGPSEDEIRQLVRAALRAPDHQRLKSFRFFVIDPYGREALADAFEAAERELNPSVGGEKLERAREKAFHAPVLLAVISRLQENDEVPEIEQRASVGAALGYVVLAANLLGYGAMAVSGRKVATQVMRRPSISRTTKSFSASSESEHLRRAKGHRRSPTQAFSRLGLSSDLCGCCGRLRDVAHEPAYGLGFCARAGGKRICQQAVGNLSRTLWDNFGHNDMLWNSRFCHLQTTR